MSESDLSPTQQRTRAALIRAGIDVLSNDPSAPLGEVAARAEVARSTLHRYFTDKYAMTAAITEFVTGEHDAALLRANLADGTGLEAMRRLALELMDRLDVLAWIMGPAVLLAQIPDGGLDELVTGEPDQAVLDAVARGIDDGSIDPALSPAWCESLLWSVLFSANHAPAASGMTTTEARSQALRTLVKAIAADPGAVR
jgi:AcrR family transcriptional regulator